MTAAPPKSTTRTAPIAGPEPVASPGLPADPAAALLGSDRVELRRPVALAALGRLDRLHRPSGPVVARGRLAAFLLAPGAAEAVPELLHWLGWGAELDSALTARTAAPTVRRGPGNPVSTENTESAGGRLPRPRGAGDVSPRPARRLATPQAVWLRHGEPGPGLDLRSPDLLRLLDCLADACARDLMGLAPAR
ncbi:hypothetical protein [Kitasatospora sp. GP82]|uniref:hypothetical protein n=1 Tax=Kitasatospora sp. GP82 TaxID=3035089 RepID=UPI0024739D9A|nr:hypothetical protein [Kitasatospora sp. GP82]MDH6124452.1 hypothetical protein [Kitasatospora sp. GP82]